MGAKSIQRVHGYGEASSYILMNLFQRGTILLIWADLHISKEICKCNISRTLAFLWVVFRRDTLQTDILTS